MAKPEWGIDTPVIGPEYVGLLDDRINSPFLSIWKTLVLADRSQIMQDMTALSDGSIVVSQEYAEETYGQPSHVLLTRFYADGTKQTRDLPYDAHGDYLTSVNDVLYLCQSDGSGVKFTWDGATLAATWPYKRSGLPAKGPWLQSEEGADGVLARLYGSVYDADGPRPRYDGDEIVPANVKFIKGVSLWATIDAVYFGRKADGTVLDYKFEPEGVASLTVNGVPCWLFGCAIGAKGRYSYALYLVPRV